MTQIAQIQTQKIDLYELIEHSPSLSAEKKEYWKTKVPTLTPGQQRELAQIFLDEQRQLEEAENERETNIEQAVTEFVQNVEAATDRQKKQMWQMAEGFVAKSDQSEEDDLLNQLNSI